MRYLPSCVILVCILAMLGSTGFAASPEASFQLAKRADEQGKLAKAVQLYRMAAEQGHAQAQNSLGHMYRMGDGVAKNFAEAVKWYRKAAEQGLHQAQYNLGFMYDEGLGVRQNSAEATRWFQKAAAQGNPGAQLELRNR